MIRNDFVSNSSSSSFIFAVKEQELNILIKDKVINKIVNITDSEYVMDSIKRWDDADDEYGCILFTLCDGCDFLNVEITRELVEKTLDRCKTCKYGCGDIYECKIHLSLNKMIEKLNDGYRLIKIEASDDYSEDFCDLTNELNGVETIKKNYKDMYILSINNH